MLLPGLLWLIQLAFLYNPGMVLSTVGWTFPCQSLVKKVPQIHTHRLIRWMSLFPGDSSFCNDDKALPLSPVVFRSLPVSLHSSPWFCSFHTGLVSSRQTPRCGFLCSRRYLPKGAFSSPSVSNSPSPMQTFSLLKLEWSYFLLIVFYHEICGPCSLWSLR